MKGTDKNSLFFENLAHAIILQAVKDYRSAMAIIRSSKKGSERQFKAANTITEIRLFFRSDWFKELCDLEPESLINRLDAEF